MAEFERQPVSHDPAFRPAAPVRATLQPLHAPGLQPLGNQAAQRFAQSCPVHMPSPTACPFGGACHACPARAQAKLAVNTPGDEYEQEADRVAEQVMAMPEPRLQRACPSCDDEERVQAKPLAEQITPLLQRQAEPEDEEEGLAQRQEESPEKEEEEPVQTKPVGGQSAPVAPGLRTRVAALRGGGQPLSQAARGFFESRFGRDFGDVRVHTGGIASQAARAARARAFTVGSDVVFNAGEYAPATSGGQELLAHELTHVVQQSGGAFQSLQRRIVVEDPDVPLPGSPPRTKVEDVEDYIHMLSSDFTVVRGGTTTVEPRDPGFCATPHTRITPRCLCDLHNSTDPIPWKIKIDDTQWPHTERRPDGRVTAHSSRSVFEFGAWGGGPEAGRRVMLQNARVLGHELCGHAWLMELNIHPPFVATGGGRPSHDVTVMIENQMAREVWGTGPGSEQRGTFSDPHHGESFGQVTVSNFPFGSSRATDLSPDMQARLVAVKDFCRNNGGILLDVIGHADHPSAGGPSANMAISRARARSVRDYLASSPSPVAYSQFRAVIGKSDAECPTSTPGQNPDCRKVDVYLFGYEAASERHP